MEELHQYYGKDKNQHMAYVTCRYCGKLVGRALAQSEPDVVAMTDAIADGKQHLLACVENPKREISEMEEWMDKIRLKNKAD